MDDVQITLAVEHAAFDQTEDWRDDTRMDQILALAEELFPRHTVYQSAERIREGEE